MGKLNSLDARGKFGFSGGLGRLTMGYNRLGFYNWYCGIYQKKYIWGKPYISRSKFYAPSNPRTVAQQAWRAVFTAGKAEYDTLTTTQKEKLRQRAKGKNMTGYNLFMSEYLNEHKI